MPNRPALWACLATGSFIALVLVVLAAGCEADRDFTPADAAEQRDASAQPDRRSHDETILEPSAPPKDKAPVQIGSLSAESVGKVVTVKGEIVQQCPASGCWFQIKDESGQAFVDLLSSNLRLTEQRVGQKAEITGRVVKRGGDVAIEAQDVQFATR